MGSTLTEGFNKTVGSERRGYDLLLFNIAMDKRKGSKNTEKEQERNAKF